LIMSRFLAYRNTVRGDHSVEQAGRRIVPLLVSRY
jgi:hypothetical protein